MSIALLGKLGGPRALRGLLAVAAALAVAALAVAPAQARFTQQGSKLVANDALGHAVQGDSIALSADGNTAIVGGSVDNGGVGAAFVFVRIGGVWVQEDGGKLFGSGAVGNSFQGTSVALSADGNTAMVGGAGDNGTAGAAWVFTRDENGVWMQQGGKLVGTGAVGNSFQGRSVALSADGNTAIVGGDGDNGNVGAAWVFIRDGSGVWTQQGGKLAGGDAVGEPRQGRRVALSADGATAIVGGRFDNGEIGAAWMFSRNENGVWTQQGDKLVGADAVPDSVGRVRQGESVALSADGNTAIVGGNFDNNIAGAAWVFVRDSNGAWTQQGNKLVGAGAVGPAVQGASVALSADGNTAIVGGSFDNNGPGAAWVFRRSRAGVWMQLGQKLVGTGAVGMAGQGHSVALSGDGNTAMVGGPTDNGSFGGFAGAVWVFGRPGVTEVLPDTGTVDGGASVLILGSNLVDVTGVTFGGVPATEVFEFSPGAVFATTPPHAGGRVRVDVTTRTGTGRAQRAYTYRKHPTATSLTSSQSPSRVGQRVRFTATVSAGGGPASGRVAFDVDGQVLGTRPLRDGVATILARDLAAGAHRVRAIFLPNGLFASSRAVLRQRVRQSQAPGRVAEQPAPASDGIGFGRR